MNHRKNGIALFDPATGKMLEGIGHYGYSRVHGERRILSVCDTPYPCALDRGILTGVAIRFNSRAIVAHYPELPCRKQADPNCTYLITW
jgi:hypothetical protein